MFKLATCREFVDLKKKYPDHDVKDPIVSWGLKQNGKLFILDQILSKCPQTVLEVGGGLDRFFAHRFGSELEYWMIDNGDLYPDPNSFRDRINSFQHTHFVDGLLGGFHQELMDNYFDMIFSISALEHTPRNRDGLVDEICRDMYRCLKPGGYACHTIDLVPADCIGMSYLQSMQKTGFLFEEEPKPLSWDVTKCDNQILLESLHVAYEVYYGPWRKKGKKVKWFHFGSILIMARRPIEK